LTRVARAEEVLLLLRAHLQRAQRARSKSKSTGASATRTKALDRVQALASTESLSDAEFEHALVAGMLEEQFGSATKNDVKFQAMVREIVEIVRGDDAGRELMTKAAEQLRTQSPRDG
jgi:hypothetical protein